jgi:hypothetical protein
VVTYLRDGDIHRQEVDTKYEGRYDLVRFFEHGRLTKEAYDTNGDGRADVWVAYNELGEKVFQEEDTEYNGTARVRYRFAGGKVVSKELIGDTRADGPPRLLMPKIP